MTNLLFDWFELFIMLLFILILIFTVYACCKHFFNRHEYDNPRTPPSNRRTSRRTVQPLPTVSTVSGGRSELQMTTMSGSQSVVSPFVFLPPPYDTLPKDPPKYEDIYMLPAGQSGGEGVSGVGESGGDRDGGEVNAAFRSDHGQGTVDDVQIMNNSNRTVRPEPMPNRQPPTNDITPVSE